MVAFSPLYQGRGVLRATTVKQQSLFSVAGSLKLRRMLSTLNADAHSVHKREARA